jgi:antitoxin component YwqK of YwqJK toxin-antitoxin module
MENYNGYDKAYDDNGNISCERYSLNNFLHRTDGPAWISYYENGNVAYEQYALNGLWHRIDGPAVIQYDESGFVIMEICYLLNIEVTRGQLCIPGFVDAFILENS